MPLIDLSSFKKSYTINVKCDNCRSSQELTIPKGNSIEAYLKSEEAVCKNCGCATLKRRVQE